MPINRIKKITHLAPSHRSTRRGALGRRGAPPGSAPMHYLRTHAGQDGKECAWQTSRIGGRDADKGRVQCTIPFVASPQVVSRELRSFMGEKGERTRGTTKISEANRKTIRYKGAGARTKTYPTLVKPLHIGKVEVSVRCRIVAGLY